MEEIYIERAKSNLVNARSELKDVLSMLDDGILIDESTIQSEEVSNIVSEVNDQVNNLIYYIIPEVKKM